MKPFLWLIKGINYIEEGKKMNSKAVTNLKWAGIVMIILALVEIVTPLTSIFSKSSTIYQALAPLSIPEGIISGVLITIVVIIIIFAAIRILDGFLAFRFSLEKGSGKGISGLTIFLIILDVLGVFSVISAFTQPGADVLSNVFSLCSQCAFVAIDVLVLIYLNAFKKSQVR
jgi:small-conductance mechanosensitive channel